MPAQEYEYGLYVDEASGLSEFERMVFIKVDGGKQRFRIQHGQIERKISNPCWRPVKGDGFLVGDLVQVPSPDSANTTIIAAITHMKWSYKRRKITYTLQSHTHNLTRKFSIEDLQGGKSINFAELNPELESDIQKDPDDLAAWAVYGDWLQSKDNLRGELIALDLAFQKDLENSRIQTRRQELERPFQEWDFWLLEKATGLKPEKYPEIQIHRFGGFIRNLQVRIPSKNYDTEPLNKILVSLLESKRTKLLYRLLFENLDESSLKALLQSPPLPTLRILSLHGRALLDMNKIFLKIPNLERLKLVGPLSLSANLKHKTLKVLKLDVDYENIMTSLTKGFLPQLDILDLRFNYGTSTGPRNLDRRFNYVSSTGPRNLDELVESKALPNLKYLIIRVNYDSNENIQFIESIFPSNLMKRRLDKLTLEVFAMSELDVSTIHENRNALENLKELSILHKLNNHKSIKKLTKHFGERLKIERI